MMRRRTSSRYSWGLIPRLRRGDSFKKWATSRREECDPKEGIVLILKRLAAGSLEKVADKKEAPDNGLDRVEVTGYRKMLHFL